MFLLRQLDIHRIVDPRTFARIQIKKRKGFVKRPE